MKSSERIEYIDIAKGVAMLCVMMSHMCEEWLQKVLFSFEVPLFFFLSGFFLNIKRKTSEIALIRFKQLCGPFLFVASILIIFRCCILFYKNEVSFLSIFYCVVTTLKGHYGTDSMGPYWFLPALLVATIAVRWLMETKHAPIYICLTSAVSALSIRYINLPLSCQLGLASCIYLYTGWLCKHHQLTESVLFRDVLYVISFTTFWLYGISTYCIGLSVPLSIPLAITAFAAFPAFIYCSRVFTTYASWCIAPFKFVGKHTLLILGLHTLDMALNIKRYVPTILSAPYARIALTCLLAFFCVVLCKLFLRLKKSSVLPQKSSHQTDTSHELADT